MTKHLLLCTCVVVSISLTLSVGIVLHVNMITKMRNVADESTMRALAASFGVEYEKDNLPSFFHKINNSEDWYVLNVEEYDELTTNLVRKGYELDAKNKNTLPLLDRTNNGRFVISLRRLNGDKYIIRISNSNNTHESVFNLKMSGSTNDSNPERNVGNRGQF